MVVLRAKQRTTLLRRTPNLHKRASRCFPWVPFHLSAPFDFGTQSILRIIPEVSAGGLSPCHIFGWS